MRSLLCFLLLWSVAGVSAREVMSGIPEIRALARDSANLGLPVRIEAVVTLYNPDNRDLMISDGEQGLFVLRPQVRSPSGILVPGDRVRVEGATVFGGFITAVEKASVTFLGAGPRPAPRRLEAAELMSPSLTLSWVEISALVVAMRRAGEFTQLTAEVHGYQWPVMLPYAESNPELAARLMQRPVTIRGIIGNNSNADGQMTSRLLYVQSFDDIVPERAAQTGGGEAPPLTPANRLLQNTSRVYEPVRVQGVLTHAQDGTLFLQGDGGALLVRAANSENFVRGDLIEAEGFAVVAPFRPILRASSVRKLSDARVASSALVDLAEDALPPLHNSLVAVHATLLAVDESERMLLLHCRSGEIFFRAQLAPPATRPLIEPGTELLLTGICHLEPEQRELSDEFISAIDLILRDAKDIVIVRRPPWLNEQRLLWILSGLGLVTLAAFAWILLLRWQVAQQTREIAAGIERKAVENERQRVARDLHDTVEQYLTGLAIQLGNIRSRIKNSEPALPALELANRMLLHCRRETKLSIQDLRSIALERLGLAGALDELLQPLAEDAGVAIKTETSGTPFGISGAAANHLLRIAQAAVSNAVQHARADTIRVALTYHEESLELSVRDDGAGFDADSPAGHGHFGLMGMRERANKLRGVFSIRSRPGEGTIVAVAVPRRQAEGKTA